MSAICSVGFSGLELESLRIRKMSDQELLRFGHAAKSMCSPDANFRHPPRLAFVIQLDEARKEWKRRNPGTAASRLDRISCTSTQIAPTLAGSKL